MFGTHASLEPGFACRGIRGPRQGEGAEIDLPLENPDPILDSADSLLQATHAEIRTWQPITGRENLGDNRLTCLGFSVVLTDLQIKKSVSLHLKFLALSMQPWTSSCVDHALLA